MTESSMPQWLEQPEDIFALFTELEHYVLTIAQHRLQKGQLFSLCLRAAFVKCYEFNLFAWDKSNSGSAFFWLPSLRGICEEIIILNCAQNIPNRKREFLFNKLMVHDVHTRLATQSAFFSATRPLQPVLQPWMTVSEVHALEEDIRSIWRAHGWPNMRRGVIPPTRQLAERHGGGVLTTLYDYLYRLTSGTVHFSMGALLRTGLGNKAKLTTFSVKHFTGYYTAFGRVYGVFMFCVYFELFARFLRPGKAIQPKINDIRNSILSIVRWPEMVTFEEMNRPVPDLGIIINAISVYLSRSRKSLLSR